MGGGGTFRGTLTCKKEQLCNLKMVTLCKNLWKVGGRGHVPPSSYFHDEDIKERFPEQPFEVDGKNEEHM